MAQRRMVPKRTFCHNRVANVEIKIMIRKRNVMDETGIIFYDVE